MTVGRALIYFANFNSRTLDRRAYGASLNSAKISGAYFPPEFSPQEIKLSVTHGTPLRYRK